LLYAYDETYVLLVFRDDSQIHLDHGTPVFDVRTRDGLEVVEKLRSEGFVEVYNGGFGRIEMDGSFGEVEDWGVGGHGSRLSFCEIETPMYYRGSPSMNRLCEGLIAPVKEEVNFSFRSMVRGFEPIGKRPKAWKLTDTEGKELGTFDLIVLSGSSAAHPRWGTVFGDAPPLVTAANKLNMRNGPFRRALETIAEMKAHPVHVLLSVFDGEAANAWLQVPKRLIHMNNSAIVELISIQPLGGDGKVAVVAHTSHEFAQANSDVFGHTSTAAKIRNAVSDEEREARLLDEIMKSMKASIGPSKLIDQALLDSCKPCWGPYLHRWGNAFPGGMALKTEDAVVQDHRLAFCGDFVGKLRTGTVEGALLSGLHISQKLLKIL